MQYFTWSLHRCKIVFNAGLATILTVILYSSLDGSSMYSTAGNRTRPFQANLSGTLTWNHSSSGPSFNTSFKPSDYQLDDVEETLPSLRGNFMQPICTNECRLLRIHLQSWPEGKPKGAFYYLANKKRVSWLIHSLQQLKKNFNDQFQYPVIIFREANFRESLQRRVRTCVNDTIFFQLVTLSAPPYLKRTIPPDVYCGGKTVGYKHMCRFQAKTVYEQPILQGFQYLCRLDDDSIITYPINYDIFKFMDTHNISYGYRGIGVDKQECIHGLWPAAHHYVQKHDIQTQFFNSWRLGDAYSNNFEISKLDIWLSPEYQAFIDYIDHLGGIYYHRWGDAPIKSIAVSMFVPERAVHHFGNVPYQHGSYVPVVTGKYTKLPLTDRKELYMQSGIAKYITNYTIHC